MEAELIPIPTERKPDGWRPPADIRMISADDHNMEMEHLWEERLPARFKDRAPRLWHDKATGRWHIEINGRPFDVPGDAGQISQSMSGMWNVDERLRGMDAEGIEASVLFHGKLQTLNALIADDKELYVACIDVYNEWLAEFTGAVPGRLIGVAVLPTFLRPEATRDYLQKLRQLGYKAVQMPSYPRGVRYNSLSMEPLWNAFEESRFPLSFHVGAVLEFAGHGSLGANIARNLCPFRPLLGQLMFSGVYERHPGLTTIFTEGGAGWVADALYGMDKICREYHTVLKPKLAELPSFYWKRQCYATFMDDPVAMRLIDLIGEDNVMWSLDFPHAEGVHGYAGKVAKSIYDTIGHDRAKKVLGGNAARVWGI